MKVVKKYSHLNGEEYLLVHKKDLYEEILQVISEVDGETFKTKVSEEERRVGELLYNPDALNREFEIDIWEISMECCIAVILCF